jgi:hypothetical protein
MLPDGSSDGEIVEVARLSLLSALFALSSQPASKHE